ncbi:MAG: tetratricopeptide repeat protein [Pseudomonadota bacterium]
MSEQGERAQKPWRTGRNLALACLAATALIGCELSGSQPVGYQARVDVAQRMLLSGQYDSAYRLLNEVSTDHGSQPAAHLSVGNAYLRGGAHFKARNAFNAAIRGGAETEGHLGLGRVALAQNNPTVAFEKFDAVLAVDPGNITALNGRGVAYNLRGEHQRAIGEFTKLLAINPTHLDALNNLALSHALGGSGTEAVEILSDLTQSQVTDTNLRHNLAIAYSIVGREKTAMRLAGPEMSNGQAQQTFRSVRRYRASRS